MIYFRGIIIALSILFMQASSVYAQTDLSGYLFNSGAESTIGNQNTIALPVDLLVDSDSYTPPFYRGRALPAIGTSIRLVALAHPPTIGGIAQSPSNLIYTWKQDDRVVGNVSGQGRSSATLPSAMLYGSTNIEVDVESTNHILVGSATISIPATEPAVLLYEDNPLIGIAFNHALANTNVIPETEATFAAVPFFASASSANDPRLEYSWTLNANAITPSVSDPSELTVNSAHSNGLATIGLTLQHATNFFMDFRGVWNVSLGSAGSNGFSSSVSGGSDPFGGTSQ